MTRFRFRLLVTACLLLGDLVAPEYLRAEAPLGPLFKEGDRVVLLGDAFVERLQVQGYLETVLAIRAPQANITFRNLGWSGDTVWGDARGVFGGRPEGYKRMLKDATECKPTVIVLNYGANEANAGPPGLPPFLAQYNVLLDDLKKTSARIILLSPIERENLGPPLPDPAGYNQVLRSYAAAIADLAAQRKIDYVNLLALQPLDAKSAPAKPPAPWTDNGLHYSAYGQWRAAGPIAERLGFASSPWSVSLSAAGGKAESAGTVVENAKSEGGDIKFTAKDAQLPYPSLPAHSPDRAADFAPPRLLKVAGLTNGKYELKIDGKPFATYSSEQLAQGVNLSAGPEFQQVEALRQAIGEKNQLYFHRYRPENETYLFLFRKHEQGNNAVEIPQFDPLVVEKEKQIAELRQPKPHEYLLHKLP